MEEQPKENPEVILKRKIIDLQKERKTLREENLFLHQTISNVKKQMMVLQEFVTPGNEKIDFLSKLLKEWKQRHGSLLKVKSELEVELKFKEKKIQELKNKDHAKIISDLKKVIKEKSTNSSMWYQQYQEYYAENIRLENVVEKQQSLIFELKYKLTTYESGAGGSVWIVFNSYNIFIYFLQGFFDGWIQHWSYVLWIVIILKTNLPSIKFDNT